MESYEKWRRYLVDEAGDLRGVNMSAAWVLEDMARARGDKEMLTALSPLFQAAA